jgi:hypothetical protein
MVMAEVCVRQFRHYGWSNINDNHVIENFKKTYRDTLYNFFSIVEKQQF